MLPYRPVGLPSRFPGRLYLTEMPGYYRPVEVHTRPWPLLADGTTDARVVCLADEGTRARGSVNYGEFLKVILPTARWVEFPITDFSVPDDLEAFLTLLDELAGVLSHPGGLVVIHCAAGIGRTGTVAASLLVRMGLSPDQALKLTLRAGSEPENEEQERFVQTIPRRPDSMDR